MKLDRSQKIIICFTLIFAFVLAVHSTSLPVKEDATNKYLDTLDLKGVDRLMIVAHPDDESLWGGAHLAKDGIWLCALPMQVHTISQDIKNSNMP